ncbi:hypothetical protein D3C80_1552600 [compost metagenome]
MLNAAGHETCQVVIAAADQVALEHLIDQADIGLEFGEVLALVVMQSDLGEYRDRLGDLGQIEMGTVAGDIPCCLEPFDPLQAWAGRQAHGIGQTDVGDATVFLQFDQNINVDSVQLD